MPPRTKIRPADIAVLCAIALVLGACFLLVVRHNLMADENVHGDQIMRFLKGDFHINGLLTAIPGYHAAVALLLSLPGWRSIAAMRLVSFALSLLSVLAFYAAARMLDQRAAIPTTLQYAFFPILLPYFFLLYTDPLSLLFVLVALIAALGKRPTLSALFAVLSMAVRQNNIIWLLFFPSLLIAEALLAHRSLSWRLLLRITLAWLRRSWLSIVGVLLFAAFVWWNQGIALGDRGAHPPFTLHLGNVYFLLFTFFFLFLPLHVANVPRFLRLPAWQRNLAVAGVLFFYAFFLFTFVNDHFDNQASLNYFLRNRILTTFATDVIHKTIFYVPVGLSLLSLAATRLRRASFYLLYPMTLLFLLPSWLIEQRYYLIPFAFFLLMRERRDLRIEYAFAVYCALGAGYLFWGVAHDWFFL